MAAALSDSLVAYVTNAEAGLEVRGASSYMDLMSGGDAEYSADVTQVVRRVTDTGVGDGRDQGLSQGRTLHNHAGFLARFDADGRVDEVWMVGARAAGVQRRVLVVAAQVADAAKVGRGELRDGRGVPSSQTSSRLTRASRNSNVWIMRNEMRRPLPGIPRNSPGTVPVQKCSTVHASVTRQFLRLGLAPRTCVR